MPTLWPLQASQRYAGNGPRASDINFLGDSNDGNAYGNWVGESISGAGPGGAGNRRGGSTQVDTNLGTGCWNRAARADGRRRGYYSPPKTFCWASSISNRRSIT